MSTDCFTSPQRFGDLAGWHAEIDGLRTISPVHRIDRSADGFRPFWAVLTHRDVMDVERRSTVFTNGPDVVMFPEDVIQTQKASGSSIETLVNMDGHRHVTYRSLTTDEFKPSSLHRLQPRLDALANELLDRMRTADGSCDFATDIAVWFPLAVILELFGLPTDDYPTILGFAQRLFSAEDKSMVEEDVSFNTVMADLVRYLSALTADRRQHPRDDLASLIANATIDGKPLPTGATIGYYVTLATAGHDTTSGAMAVGMEQLARHPHQLQLLQKRPDLIPNAVEEMIRYATPVRHFMRTAQQHTQIAGIDIQEGDWVYLSYLAANRDPAIFADPHRFDIERHNADRNIAFGFGPHFCLGAQLARMELRTAFSHLIPRLRTLSLAGEAQRPHTTFVGGLRSLPINYQLA
jgi:cytochrome P450